MSTAKGKASNKVESKYQQFEDEEQKIPEKRINNPPQEKKVDDDDIPPKFDLCERHHQANRVGIEDKESNEICVCCTNKIAKTPIALCDNIDKLAYMGPGYPLFFLFSKYAILILSTIFLVSGLYGLYSNYSGTACTEDDSGSNECYNYIYMYLSLANKKNDADSMDVQQWLNFALVPILIVIIQLMRRHIRQTASDCDQRDISAADYTIMVEHVPLSKEGNYKEELKALIENETFNLKGKQVNFEVCKINLTYKLDELYKLKAEEEATVAKKNQAFVTKFKTGSFPNGVTVEKLDEEINKKEKIISDYESDLANGRRGDFTGVAFVSLKTEAMKQELIHRYKVSTWTRFKVALLGGAVKKGLILRNQRLYVSQAAEPGDVYWENLHYTDKQLYFKKFLGVCFTLFLLFLCGCLIFYLTYEQNVVNGTTGTSTTSSTTTAATTDNSTTNTTSARLLSTHFRTSKHLADNTTTSSSDANATTSSDANTTTASSDANTTTNTSDSSSSSSSSTSSSSSIATKLLAYTLAICVTIINKGLCFLIPYIAEFEKNKTLTQNYGSTAQKLSIALFINSGFISYLVTCTFLYNYSGSGGLVYNQTNVFVSNSFLNPFLYWLNIAYLLKMYKRKKCLKEADKCAVTQGQANIIWTDPPFPIQTVSATTINTLWYTAFYTTLTPIGLILSLFFLISSYWILKRVLLQQTSVDNELGCELTEDMTDLLEASLIFFALGNFIFNYIYNTDNQWCIQVFLILGLAIAYNLLPTEAINEKIFPIITQDEVKEFQTVVEGFDNDYDKDNPATRAFALEKEREENLQALKQKEREENKQKAAQKGKK